MSIITEKVAYSVACDFGRRGYEHDGVIPWCT